MLRARTLIRLSLLFLIVQSVLCEWKPKNPKTESLCNTPECVARGKEYKSNIDTNVNPCQDFYTFTCGNFHKNHPVTKYAAEWNVIDLMNSEFAGIIRRLLESYKFPPNEKSLFRQAKEVYETCTKIPEYPKKEANDIAREVMKIGRVPKTPLTNMHTNYLKLSGESAFFSAKVLGSKPSEGIPVLMLMEPPSAYGSIFHEGAWKPQEEQAYTDFLFHIMKSLRLTGSDALIKERIKKVFDFRKKLDQRIKQNARLAPDNFIPLTVKDLDALFSDNIRNVKETETIHWKDVVETLLQNLPQQMRQDRKVVAIRQKEYFIDLLNLLEDVPEEVIAFHMEIFFVERHLKLNENMLKLLEATTVEANKQFNYIREEYYPRWQTCIQNLNMKETLEELIYNKWFQKTYAETIRQMMIRLKMTIGKQMKSSKWLDEPAREKALVKLVELEDWIGFPSWITGSGIHKERNKKEILRPNAALYPKYELLYIQAPLLLPPVFSPTIPAVYNYAGIGSTIAHELYHIIDDCGNNLETTTHLPWWSNAMRVQCQRKKELFIEEFNKITDREFKKHYNVVVKSDTSSTVLENFSDVMGLVAAYNSYKELYQDKSVCQTLPQFEKYSCDQMFFITFANGFCGYNSKRSAQMKLEKSVHSIDSVRINGAVAQMKSFGAAFGCPVGSPMNPQKKLDLWQ